MGFDPLRGFQPAASNAKRKKMPAKRRATNDAAVMRKVAVVSRTTRTAAPRVVKNVKRTVVAARSQPAVDPVVARGDAIAARIAKSQTVSPEQAALRKKVVEAYTSETAGFNPALLNPRLVAAASAADPAITVTEKITRPFTTPQTAVGNLIAGRPVEALKNVGSLSYKGRYTTPSEELNKRGWLPKTGASHYLLGLGADVAPSFLIPGFKGAGAAKGELAARAVSRAQVLPHVTREPVRMADQAASLPRATPRPQRATRLRPNVGPDILTNPSAPTVRLNNLPGGVGSRGSRASVPRAPRRGASQMPYLPKNVQRALAEFQATVSKYRDVTQRTPTLLQASRAGEKLGRAAEATAAAERATVRKIRGQADAQGASAALRPRSVPELRSSSVTPVQGGRGLPRLRSRVVRASEGVQQLTTKTPSAKKVGKVGQRLVKVGERLKAAESAMFSQARAPRRPDIRPSDRQAQVHNETFTGSLTREWIDANMEYAAARQAAKSETPIGLNITAPWNRRGKGVTIPLLTKKASASVKGAVGNSRLGDWRSAYGTWLVSRYGPNPVVKAGAVAADNVIRMERDRTIKFIRETQKKHGIKPGSRDDRLASAWIEGTTHKPVSAKVRAYAEEMARFTEENAGAFIRAGGQLKRFGKSGKLNGGLDSAYVMHLLPPGEREAFAVSGLARRHLYYGSKPSFMKRREALTIAELKRAGYHPIENLSELTLARANAHSKAMADMELSRLVSKRYGKHVADAPGDWQLVPSQFTNDAFHVPKDVAETLRNVAEARSAIPKNIVSERLQQANQWWKEWALATSGHHIRNEFGDTLLMFQNTMNPIAPFAAKARGAKILTGKGKVGGRSDLTSRQARRAAEVSGIREHGLLAGDILDQVSPRTKASTLKRPSVRRPERAAIKFFRKLGTTREGVNRTGVFANELRKGEGIVHAASKSHDTLYNYSDVGKAVAWARKSPLGAPFATWLAKNLPKQFRLAVENPAQLSAQLAALQSLYTQSGSPPRFLQQDYQRQSIGIPIPGRGYINSLQPPINSFNMLPANLDSGSIGDAARGLYSNVAPLGQAPLALFGLDPLTGRSFNDVVAASGAERFLQGNVPGGQILFGPPQKTVTKDSKGNKIAVPAVSARGSWFARQVWPGFGTASKLSPPAGRSVLTTASGPVAGFSTSKFYDRKAMEGQLAYIRYHATRELIPDFEKRLKATAPGWRRGDPVPSGLRSKYNEITRLEKQAEVLAALLAQKG